MTGAMGAASEATPPMNIEAELSLLAIIIDSKSAAWSARDLVSPEMFYQPAHGDLFAVVMDLVGQGVEISFETLWPNVPLKLREELQAVGGLEGIASAGGVGFDPVPRCDAVRDAWARRKILEHATELRSRLHNPGRSWQDSLSDLGAFLTDAHGAMGARRRSVQDIIDEVEEDAVAGPSNAAKSARTPSLYHDLDRVLAGGLRRGAMYVVAARPSMGKSAFVSCMLLRQVQKGIPALLFSLEVSTRDIVTNMACALGKISVDDVFGDRRKTEFVRTFRSTINELRDMPIHIVDQPDIDIDGMRSVCREYQERAGVRLIAVDYLQLVRPSRSTLRDGRERQVAHMSATLKESARACDLPIVVLSQLNRGVESRDPANRRPRMSDLRESGAIEQDADAVMLLYREAYYETDERLRSMEGQDLEVMVAKNRGGRTGLVRTLFFPQTGPRVESQVRGGHGPPPHATPPAQGPATVPGPTAPAF